MSSPTTHAADVASRLGCTAAVNRSRVTATRRLMDVQMPHGDGLVATRRIASAAPNVRVMILTMFDVDDYVTESLRSGPPAS